MAFYFALLNVSAKKEETKQHKHRRRRHSIASVESPLLDYRLLPRPQMVDEDDEKKKLETRGMKKSESNYSTGGRRKEVERRKTPDKKARPKSRDHSFRDNPRDSACSSSAMSEMIEPRKEKKKKELEKQKPKKQLLAPQKKPFPPIIHPPPNSPAIVGNISPAVSELKGPSKQMGVVRPIFHRRRQSPPESTTSGSRRSSKGSQASLPRRDTPSSSNCSRRESEEPTHGIGGLVQASQKLAAVHLTRPQEKFPHFKRVTFNGSPLVIKNNFLGEPAVLVQKGHTVLRRSSTAAPPLAACGVDWWGVCADSRPGEGENVANGAVEEDSRLKRLRPSLLRRRSTSDRGRVAFVLHNEGYMTDDQEKDRKNGNHGSYLKRAGTTKG